MLANDDARRFTNRATLSDGYAFDLPGAYATQAQAERAASNFIRDYSDPCGLGVHVSFVSTIDSQLAARDRVGEVIERAAIDVGQRFKDAGR